MNSSERVVRELQRFERLAPRGASKEEVSRLNAAVTRLDSRLVVADGRINLVFQEAPPAGPFAEVVERIDREARRAATALTRSVAPRELYGRGARLLPRRSGLTVSAARPGSLEITLVLGGVYAAIASQPLSFALNLANLLQYGKAIVRATLPGGRAEQAELPVEGVPSPSGQVPLATVTPAAPVTVIPTPYGPMLLPYGVAVSVSFTQQDGTTVEIDYQGDPAAGGKTRPG